MRGYVGQTLWQLSAGMLGSEGKCDVSGGRGAWFCGQSAVSAEGWGAWLCEQSAMSAEAGLPGAVIKARWLMGAVMPCYVGSAIKVDALLLAGQGNGRAEVT